MRNLDVGYKDNFVHDKMYIEKNKMLPLNK